MFQKSKFFRLISLVLLASMLLAACSQATTEAPMVKDTLAPAAEEATEVPAEPTEEPMGEPVEISYIYPNGIPVDLEKVQDAMSELLKGKINVTIKLVPVDWGAYTDKVNLMVSSGEECDILFVAPWMAPSYAQLVANGALLPLNDLLDANAPEMVAEMPVGAFDATKINGNIYGVPNQQIWVKPFGPVIRKDLADKYEFDSTAITKVEDLEPLLMAIYDGEEGVFPASGGNFLNEYFGWDPIVTQDVAAVVQYDDNAMTVFNAYDTPEFAAWVELMYKWYNANYFPADEIPGEEFDNQWKAGKFGMNLLEVIKPGGELEFKSRRGFDVYGVNLSPIFMTTGSVTATMNGVCASSKNPDKAVQVLNLLNTDKDVYNLLAKGIEDVHWVWVDQAANVIGPGPSADNYAPNTDWMFGSVFNAFYNDPAFAELNVSEETAQINANAVPSVALGFTFNPEPVKSELAQVSSVVTELGRPLWGGLVDPATGVPEFLQALEDAGMGRIVEEAQNQLNAWAGK